MEPRQTPRDAVAANSVHISNAAAEMHDATDWTLPCHD